MLNNRIDKKYVIEVCNKTQTTTKIKLKLNTQIIRKDSLVEEGSTPTFTFPSTS